MKIKVIATLLLFFTLLITNVSANVDNILLYNIDASLCGSTVTISGLDTITTNTTNQQYTSDCGLVSWSISGTGATINSSGQVTTTGTACGSLTITATYPGGSTIFVVRVADLGQWVYSHQVDYCSPPYQGFPKCNAIPVGGIGTLNDIYGNYLTDPLEAHWFELSGCSCIPVQLCSGKPVFCHTRDYISNWQCP